MNHITAPIKPSDGVAHPLIDPAQVDKVTAEVGITSYAEAAIRQIGAVVRRLQQQEDMFYVRLEIGVPGLPPSSIGIEAEKSALDKGVAAIYSDIEGLGELKTEASRFIKAFVNTDVAPECCCPTVGSMMGSLASFIMVSQMHHDKDTVLFIDPGFSVQKNQLTVLGIHSEAFDIYNYRAEKLHDQLEGLFRKGNIAAVIYSNPNNPAWICLTEAELQTIGQLCTQYDVIAIEDLAYLGMDFRRELGHPWEPPYQPSVTHYTDNYIMLLSASKIFSYAGQRIAVMVPSDKLFHRHFDNFMPRYGKSQFGQVLIHNILYTLSSGTSHTAQYALAAMFRAASDGTYDFVHDIRIYGQKCAIVKDIFLRHGFHIIYDRDLDQTLGDGFFFTVGYGDMEGSLLLHRLMYYGVSAIDLATTGSHQKGLRICCSVIPPSWYAPLEERLTAFDGDFGHTK